MPLLSPLFQIAPKLIMKDRPPPSYGAVYVPPHQRLRSVIASRASIPSLPHLPALQQQNNNNFSNNHNKNINDDNKKRLKYNSSSAYSGVSEEGSDRELDTWLLPVSVIVC